MTYLLDSDTCITHLRSRAAHPVSARLLAVPVSELALPAIVASELLFGAIRAPGSEMRFATERFCDSLTWLAFDDRTARTHASIRAALAAANAQIGPYDSMVAATALRHSLILVTHNVREFSRVAGLQIQDWHAT